MGLPWEHSQHGETGVWGSDFVSKVVHLLEATAKKCIFIRIFFGVDERLGGKKKAFAVPF